MKGLLNCFKRKKYCATIIYQELTKVKTIYLIGYDFEIKQMLKEMRKTVPGFEVYAIVFEKY